MKYVYIGNCVNLFRKNGDCVFPEIFTDVSDFAVKLECARNISRARFLKRVDIPKEIMALTHPKRSNFLSLDNGRIYVLQDKFEDIEYIFA